MKAKNFEFIVGKGQKALQLDGYYVWDCSVIKSGGKYHMFSSRWKKELGFGWNWVFNSEIIHSVSDKPEGPYKFLRVVLPRRGRQYFFFIVMLQCDNPLCCKGTKKCRQRNEQIHFLL